MNSWSLQNAKARFSELVNRAHAEGPQRVSKHGKDSVVVVAAKDYERLTRCRAGKDRVRFLRNAPLAAVPPENFNRQRDRDRKIKL